MISKANINTKHFAYALASHVLLLVLCVALSHNIDVKDNKKMKYQIHHIQSSVRVDVVAMPEFTKEELKQAVSIKETMQKKEPVDELEDSSEPIAQKVDLSNLLGKISEKKINLKKVNKKNNIDKTVQKKLRQLILQGNKVSKGNSRTGESLQKSNDLFINYIENIPLLVSTNWKLPSYLIDKDLKCRIQIFVGGDGEVLNYKLIEKSGEDEFDQRALSALKMTKNLGTPPVEIVPRLASGEVILGFPL